MTSIIDSVLELPSLTFTPTSPTPCHSFVCICDDCMWSAVSDVAHFVDHDEIPSLDEYFGVSTVPLPCEHSQKPTTQGRHGQMKRSMSAPIKTTFSVPRQKRQRSDPVEPSVKSVCVLPSVPLPQQLSPVLEGSFDDDGAFFDDGVVFDDETDDAETDDAETDDAETDAETDDDETDDDETDTVAVACCPWQKHDPNELCACLLPSDDGFNVYGPLIPSDCEADDSDDDDDDLSTLARCTAVSVYVLLKEPDADLVELTRQAISNADSHRFFRRVLLWKCCFDVARQLRVMNVK